MGWKITLFEPHLEGAQFGTKFVDEAQDEASGENEDVDSSSSGGSNLARVLGLVVGSLVLLAVYRRIRSGESDVAVDAELKPQGIVERVVGSDPQ